jgi:hypothetical protein
MNLASLWAEIEEEHTWRVDELRFFQNQLFAIESEARQKTYRKALVLLLYSHFEGFCKFAFSHYVRAINSEGLNCADVNWSIAAASLSELFAQLRHPDSKCVEFRNTLPDDAKLHRFARDREFLANVNLFDAKAVAVPDEIVDTESNLKPVVLRKILFRIGMQYDRFVPLEGRINRLLNMRNNIAHGVHVGGVEKTDYESLRDDVNVIMTQVKRDVMTALSSGEYRRA